MRIWEDCKAWLHGLSRQRAVSVLGIVMAVASAMATRAGAIRPGVAILLTLVATLAAALGKALRESVGNQWLTVAAIILAVANTLTGFTEMFSADTLAWMGVLTAGIAAFGKTLFGVDFGGDDDDDHSGKSGGFYMKTMAALLLAVTLTFSGCWLGGGPPEDQLANANFEISGLIGDAQTAILEALKARVIKPETALAAGGLIERGNLSQQIFLSELVKRLEDDKNASLSEADKTFLVSLVQTLNETASQIVASPEILSLDSGTRAGVTVAILALKPLTLRLVSLIKKAPTQKAITPSLREQLRQATDKAEIARLDNDRLFAELQAEVAK